jgi:nucleoside-diphosphate-sugar epimerase
MISATKKDSNGMMTNVRIAVLGGTGFVGRTFGERCSGTLGSSPLRILVHRSRPNWLAYVGAELRAIELDEPDTVQLALEGCTVLVNLLRPHGDGWTHSKIEALIPAIAQSGIRLVVHCSSISVYGPASANSITETSRPDPRDPYSQEHLAIEKLFAAAPMPSTILRLGAIFGQGGRNLLKLAQEIATDSTWKLALRRSLYGRRRMHLVAVETVADTIRFIALRQPMNSVDYVLVTEDDAEDNNFAFVQERMAVAFGRRIPSTPILWPVFLRLALAAHGRSLTNPNCRISGQRLTELGFKPDLEFAERIDRYASLLALNMQENKHKSVPGI